jgi:hypothetical protein
MVFSEHPDQSSEERMLPTVERQATTTREIVGAGEKRLELTLSEANKKTKPNDVLWRTWDLSKRR